MSDDPRTNEAKIYVMNGQLRAFGYDQQGVYSEINFPGGDVTPPPNGNGMDVKIGQFAPVVKLQSAASQPSGGELLGRYRIAHGLVMVSYAWIYKPDLVHGVPSGQGTSRYYFELPAEITDDLIDSNIAEHGSVRMFDGRDEMSGHPHLYSAIPRAVIAEVAGQRWNVNTPFTMNQNSQYITLGVWWIAF